MGQASPICSEVPDEGREVREMCGWDLCGGRQMLQAIHRKGPRRTIAEDLSNPGFLRAGEHSGRYRSRRRPRGPPNPFFPSTALVDSIVAPPANRGKASGNTSGNTLPMLPVQAGERRDIDHETTQ